MIITHYSHRLPSSHDTVRERDLAATRGPLWDTAPDLYFKAFLLRECGRFGATENRYSSLYLWRCETAFTEFVTKGGFQLVVDLYGRPNVPTWNVLDARRGSGQRAEFAYVEDLDIAPDAVLARECAAEVERNDDLARGAGVVTTAVAIDTRHWRLRRIRLSEDEPTGAEQGTSHQIFYLARPLLHALPRASEHRPC